MARVVRLNGRKGGRKEGRKEGREARAHRQGRINEIPLAN